MPFDRLPGHDLNIPEFKPFIAPGHPVFPTNEVVSSAMAKILDALDPVNRAQRQFALAKLPLQLQQIEMQKRWLAQASAHPGSINPATGLPYTQTQLYDLGLKRRRMNKMDREDAAVYDPDKEYTDVPKKSMAKAVAPNQLSIPPQSADSIGGVADPRNLSIAPNYSADNIEVPTTDPELLYDAL